MQLRDAGVGPERLLALVQVFYFPWVHGKPQQIKIKGLQQVVAALFVVHVYMINNLDGPLCGVASLARRRYEGVRHAKDGEEAQHRCRSDVLALRLL